MLKLRFCTPRDNAGGEDTRRSRGGGGAYAAPGRGTQVPVLRQRLLQEIWRASQKVHSYLAAAAAERERPAQIASATWAARELAGRENGAVLGFQDDK